MPRAELVETGQDPAIGHELIRVTHDNGATEELRLHEYDRLYALPGVYEAIVQDRLGCRSPDEIAGMVAEAVDALDWDRGAVRVIDVAAGNGVSGEALAARGMSPVLGTDIVAAARDAALRDRPGLYGDYWTLDLLALTGEQADGLRALRANVLSAVAVVGTGAGQLPPGALSALVELMAPDTLVAYMHEPGTDDPVTPEFWTGQLSAEATELERRIYVHRQTVTGRPYELEGVAWRIRRPAAAC